MNKLRVLLARRRYAKELDRELLTWKYVWFNAKTSDYFRREDRRLDDTMQAYLHSKMTGTRIELSAEAQEFAARHQGYIRRRLTDLYKYLLKVRDERPISLDLKDTSKNIEKLSLRAKMLQYMQYYNDALESLVEGQREVLRDKDFKFEDGLTAEQKEDKLRDFINKYR